MSALRVSRFTRRLAGLGDRGPEQSTVTLVRTLLLFESMLYSVVAPVLPHYAHTLHASKPAIGVLAAAYPAGMLPGSLIAGLIATRAGVRRTTVVGLLLFAASIAGFGFGTSIITLDLLRFIQGAACGFIWGGGLAWVIAVAPRERRGEVLGTVIGAAIFGTILGPVLGTVAVALGTQVAFAAVGALSIALAVWTLDHPEPPQPEASASTPLRTLAATPRVVLGFWLILLEAATLGALGTLLPLRLSHFGATGVEIGITFIVSSVVSAIIARPIGRAVDRRGAGLPLSLGLMMTAVLLVALPLPHAPLALAGVSVITLGGPLTAYTIPAISVITDSVERLGVALALASTLLNLAWATGETIGAPAAATLSQATSDAVPILLLAGIMVITLVPVTAARLGRPAPQPVTPQQSPPEARVPVGTA